MLDIRAAVFYAWIRGATLCSEEVEMASKFLARFVLLCSLAAGNDLAGQTAKSATQIKQAMTHSSWGTRLLNKAATWSVIALLSTTTVIGNVAAQDITVTRGGERQYNDNKTWRDRFLPRTPLHEAIKQLDYNSPAAIDYSGIEEILATGEANVNAKDAEGGNTALHLVAKDLFYLDNYENFKLTKLILAHKADPNLRNYERKTPLAYVFESHFCCVDRKTVEMPRLLVSAGADLHEVDYSTYAADGLAIHNALEAATVLVMDRYTYLSLLEKEAGGLAQVVQEQGEHLLKLAAEWGNATVVEALLDHGVDADAGMFGMALSQQRELPRQMVMGILISRGANINSKDGKQGGTPLHLAVEEGHDRGVELLLERRANPDLADKHGQTALHRAAARKGGFTSFTLVSTLLAHAAKANVTDNAGHTPYDYAVKNYASVSTINKTAAAANAALLLYAQMGANGKDSQDRTAAYWAKLSGSKVVQRIVAGEVELAQLSDKKRSIIFELLKPIEQ